MALPAPQRQPVLAMSACPFAWDWMAAVTGLAGTRGCSLPEGHTFHDTAIATNSAVTWAPGTSIGRVRITKSILRDRDPCALSDLIAETVRRNPEITAFHVPPSGADYSSLLESLSTRLPSDHTRIHSHYMAAHPVDAEPPTTLRFASTKPKPATFAKEGWHKEPAKRKLFLFDPWQSGEETLPLYSLSSRSAWEWDGDGPGLTVPTAYAASELLALPVTSTPLFVAHEDPLLELPSDCPTAVNSDPSQLAGLQHLFTRSFFAEYEVEEAHKEALAIAQERWARIFNHNRPVAGRAHDPPDRKMLWGKPGDMAKHPDGEEHIRLWDLPRLSAMVTRVKAKLEAIFVPPPPAYPWLLSLSLLSLFSLFFLFFSFFSFLCLSEESSLDSSDGGCAAGGGGGGGAEAAGGAAGAATTAGSAGNRRPPPSCTTVEQITQREPLLIGMRWMIQGRGNARADIATNCAQTLPSGMSIDKAQDTERAMPSTGSDAAG